MKKKFLFKILKLNIIKKGKEKKNYSSYKFNCETLKIIRSSLFSKRKSFQVKMNFSAFKLDKVSSIKPSIRFLTTQRFFRYFEYSLFSERWFFNKLTFKNVKNGKPNNVEKKLKNILYNLYSCFKVYQKSARLKQLKLLKSKQEKINKRYTKVKSKKALKNFFFRYYHLSSYIIFSRVFYKNYIDGRKIKRKYSYKEYKSFLENLNLKMASKIIKDNSCKKNIWQYSKDLLDLFLKGKYPWYMYEYILDLKKKVKKKYKKRLKKYKFKK